MVTVNLGKEIDACQIAKCQYCQYSDEKEGLELF
jgi:hypothetical protein